MKRFAILAAAASLLVLSCSGGSQSGEDIRSFSEPAADSALRALDSGNYSDFSKDFDQRMFKIISPAFFGRLKTDLMARAGSYAGLTYINSLQSGDYYRVNFRATYSLAPAGIGVSVVMKKAGGRYWIDGFFFD